MLMLKRHWQCPHSEPHVPGQYCSNVCALSLQIEESTMSYDLAVCILCLYVTVVFSLQGVETRTREVMQTTL